MSDKAILTCAVTGVLTDPTRFAVPVTPAQMAASTKEAYDAGASIVHVHFRKQEAGMGRFPTWDPDIAEAIVLAIKEACPDIIINMSTGVMGPKVDEPLACLYRLKPEIAACNAGTLNYLKTRRNGAWAWPPMIFQNGVPKIKTMLKAMKEVGSMPEMECFDVGIVRSVAMYEHNGMCADPHYNFVMGVASGMPVDVDLLDILLRYKKEGAHWQVTAIGRSEIWPLHQKVAERGGMLRTGLEDTFYLPNGEKSDSNGALIEALAVCARNVGREIASPTEARTILGLN
ncbi:MAG: 3-keto-5-aminohexanoate cleavage protein [Myxococcota bacterium]|nr:3-keto-5-aminohexanoate cleavage protein [Myxococcota bacterium]